MSKTNRRKRELQEERMTQGDANPMLYTHPHPFWFFLAPVLTMPGKPPHRICKGKP